MDIELLIYEIITKKLYSREKPYLEEKLKERLHYFVSKNEPIKLIGFWGIGPKDKPNRAEMKTCDHLTKMDNEVKTIYAAGIDFTFIFATTHALHNGIDKKNIDAYIKEMEKKFQDIGFKYIYLNILRERYGISFDRIDRIFKEKKENWWNQVENNKLIEHSAIERNKKLDPKTAAQKYYIMRNIEKKIIEKEFTSSIFHTFSDSRFRNVLPNLPTLYLYSIKKYRSDAPWFVIKDN